MGNANNIGGLGGEGNAGIITVVSKKLLGLCLDES